MTLQEYLNLITSEYRQKPKFVAMMAAELSLMVWIQDLLTSMVPLFDLDTAVGDQLDILGKWAGISRNINIPIPGSEIYFTWDGAASVGWDYGIWPDSTTPFAVTVLPDDVYRTLIKTKIAANHWDGTIDGAYAVWDALFTTVTILIKDNQDMTYDLAFVGGIIDSLTLALVLNGEIQLKPEGVRLREVLTPANAGPLFGWDLETDLISGWDVGSWPYESSVS